MVRKVDFLVVGSGIAGLSYALKAASYGTVCVITKNSIEETNTRYAQGGIASVTYPPDSFEKHIRDTIQCGDGYCNEKIVEMVVKEAPDRINELLQWGVEFDKREDGKFDLAREGGHSSHRILHHKDYTGLKIHTALIEKVKSINNIQILEDHFAIDLITQHQLGIPVARGQKDIQCYGAYVLDLHSRDVDTVLSKVTIIATGGTGNLYHTTTNPPIATGDGIAMVYRAKGVIEHMEFVQFHPTSLYHPGERPSFLITEAIRGFGAILKSINGEEFMEKYDPRGSLASRDIVARAIDNEMKIQGDDFVYLDCTHLDTKALKKNFPNVYKKCLSIGIDITKDMIPVVPAAHYLCGGIKVNEHGQSSVERLYAIGEAASTGLHGANRLASNSLIEAIVFAHRAVADVKDDLYGITFNEKIPEWDYGGTSHPEEMVLITQSYKEMQQIMSNYVGIVRSDLRLQRALVRLDIIYRETEELYKKSTLSRKLCELRNLINVAHLTIRMAQNLRESRGLHYTIDYPKKRAGSEF